ncbi:MAG TPA: hypothetical protein VFA26_17555 [Gemmataceae bacterium]|nr:hypothetical protein [Gemmataceae bacterium]
MRRLKSRWVTLPKGSPDDNPVATTFSEVQQMVPDNSDDPDPRAAQRRISGHLSNRNRRIRNPYLEDSHKH